MQMKTEGLKLFACKFDEQTKKDINSVFSKLNSVTDFYAASLINRDLADNRAVF
jgi:hypothetical protein